MTKGYLALSLAIVLGGCASTPRPIAQEPDPAGPRGTGYLESGPTVALADSNAVTPTTLQLLEERAKENAQLKEQLESLRGSLRAAEQRAISAEKTAADRTEQAESLRALVENAVSREKELMSELLKARILRLQLEQELVRNKVADLVRDGAGR